VIGRGRIDPRLATQVLVLQFAVVALTLVIAFGMFAVFSHRRIAYEYGVRALDIARVLAAAPVVRSGVAGFDEANRPGALSAAELASGPLQGIAMNVRRQTDVLLVVITNDRGLRLTHPDVDELGKPTSTSASDALAGREEVVHETGTLGPSVTA